MANDKIFGSDITRTFNKLNNNLYDLFIVEPATPLPANATKCTSCDFVPKTDKYLIPRGKLWPKVKTVRDIRNLFEKDVCSTLSVDMDKQQNVLLRKIRSGSSKSEKTKLYARNMLKSENPISKKAWQMLTNINPDNCAHSSQYVLWNGKCIQVNGSRGGKSKFIYKNDLAEDTTLIQKFKKRNFVIKKDLLKHSLNVRFKPGPLSRKKQLDISYQKYNVGDIEIAHLPKPGLDVLPQYGKPMDTTIVNFLHNLRDIDGSISDKWAEFAVSTLGTYDKGRAVQLNKESYVTFDLHYKSDQRRISMRRVVDKFINRGIDTQVFSNLYKETEESTKLEVQKMLDEMLVSVEISLTENEMYTGEDPPRELDTADIKKCFDNNFKDKVKRKGHSELHRLDVTVIRLCDNQEKKKMVACQNSFCSLGCICDSLFSSIPFKNHCGHIECMFECICDFNKYNLHGFFEDNIIPGLINLDKENNAKLSKEERKFHQTVILSGEKSILLKSQRRNWKAPEKYTDFYNDMSLKTKTDIKRTLSIIGVKLNCRNIEPWCMFHNLYKCFCKGKFTETLSSSVLNDETKPINTEPSSPKSLEVDLNCNNNESTNKTTLRPRLRRDISYQDISTSICIDKCDVLQDNDYKQCARIREYKKRKYSDLFYFNANNKIRELEQNDRGLHKKMMDILNIDESSDAKKPKSNAALIAEVDLSISPTPSQMSQENESLDKPKDETKNKLPVSPMCYEFSDNITSQLTSSLEAQHNKKVKDWLEPSLKIYKERFNKGFLKKSLEPPKAGKVLLYPWDFIITRYYEKKNFFFVTIQKPFRLFMAVDSRNALFNNCVDLSSVKDIDKYPSNVKNIITKEVDHLTDQLCILRGLSFCWEIVGSVKKVGDLTNSSENNDNEILENRAPFTNSPCKVVKNTSTSVPLENNIQQSKWFVMNIKHDFSEIQFHNRGFFVKHDSIIKAVNVARASDKTVRLSSQKCNEGNSDPQFGIYAVPHANEYCVFIGPYEKHEPLGIETVKSTSRNPKLKTKGVWITTNKVDNMRVIDNPLSFMSEVNMEHGQLLDDSSQDEITVSPASGTDIKSAVKVNRNKVVKLVKPIKITKTNNFYHLTPSGFLQPISVSPEKQISSIPIIIKKRSSLDLDAKTTTLLSKSFVPTYENNKYSYVEEKQKIFSKRPIAEIAPQINVREECQSNMQQKTPSRKFKGGMFVLKPEEINSRPLADNICFTPPIVENATFAVADKEIDMDNGNFLVNSTECSAPTTDVYVISDDEDYCNTELPYKNCLKDVWIICKSVKIGWIPGRQNTQGHLSFEFPGFKYTKFYSKEEAFAKITQVLARKVYIPQHMNLCWSVVETEKELQKLSKLKQEDLNPDLVLTKRGLIHKFLLAMHSNIKTETKYVSGKKCTTKTNKVKGKETTELHTQYNEDEMEKKSKALLFNNITVEDEQQSEGDLSDSLSIISKERRQKMNDRLQTIISSAHFS